MKILYVCHRFPYPPRRGGKIRPFNTIRHLARNHEVTVASLARSPEEAAAGTGIAEYCAAYEMATVGTAAQALRMVARLPTPTPSSMGFFYSSDLARRVRRCLQRTRFDLIFVHCSSAAQYVADVRGAPKLLDFGDMDSQKWLEYARHKPFPLSLGYRLEGIKLAAEERRLARRFDLCTATTRAEWEQLNRVCGDTPTDWFPNGVDTEYFAPGDQPYDPDIICFVGRMDYYPNQQCMHWFCSRVWPELRQHRPRLQLLIVGADPSPAVQRLAQFPGVTVTGSVPDVRPYLQRSALMVAPLDIARGTQNKILESMAMGLPVVCSKTAAGGVDAVAGEHLLVAGTAQGYARHILRLLRNPAERQRLSSAARARVLSHHAWDASMRKLDAIVERVLGRHRFARAELAEARA